MPIVVRTRRYDQAFYEAIAGGESRPRDANEAIAELFDF
jgi:hypothetical protein